MATIIEDYVSFETAALLKEKGFQQLQNNCGYFTTEMVYGIATDDEGEHHFAHQYPACVCNKDKYIAAPTLQMAMKWLREVHKLSVRPRYDEVEDEKEHLHYVWFFDILSMSPYKTLAEPVQGYSTYEEACETAIKYCLENII